MALLSIIPVANLAKSIHYFIIDSFQIKKTPKPKPNQIKQKGSRLPTVSTTVQKVWSLQHLSVVCSHLLFFSYVHESLIVCVLPIWACPDMVNIQTALSETVLARLQTIPQASLVLKKVSRLSLDYIIYLYVTCSACPSLDSNLMNGQTGSDPVLLLNFMKTYKKKCKAVI